MMTSFDVAAALAGVLVLFTHRGFGAGPPAAVASPNGLPWVQTFSDDFTSPSGTLNGWTKELGKIQKWLQADDRTRRG